jgi:hypothetical protein
MSKKYLRLDFAYYEKRKQCRKPSNLDTRESMHVTCLVLMLCMLTSVVEFLLSSVHAD